MSPAHKNNKYAEKKEDDLSVLIPAYIKHRAEGFSKKSFPDCDYSTIEKHLNEDEVFYPLKKELEKAEREGILYWEKIGKDITTGKLKGNPATWIFTMKNKYPEDWKDKTETKNDINLNGQITLNVTETDMDL